MREITDSYNDIAALAVDIHFHNRVAACIATLGEPTPTAWADTHQWPMAAQPGLGAAYGYALRTGVPDPGQNPAVITDQQILAAVEALLLRHK